MMRLDSRGGNFLSVFKRKKCVVDENLFAVFFELMSRFF